MRNRQLTESGQQAMKTHLMPFLFKHPISTRVKGETEQFSLTDVWRICGADKKPPSS